VIEATEEPDFFGFFSPELEGFAGVGHSVEDCLYKARWGMEEHVDLLREQGLPVPPSNPNPIVTIQNCPKAAVAEGARVVRGTGLNNRAATVRERFSRGHPDSAP
jgi:predicted RNase H-like HicB family nuclease